MTPDVEAAIVNFVAADTAFRDAETARTAANREFGVLCTRAIEASGVREKALKDLAAALSGKPDPYEGSS